MSSKDEKKRSHNITSEDLKEFDQALRWIEEVYPLLAAYYEKSLTPGAELPLTKEQIQTILPGFQQVANLIQLSLNKI